MPRVALFVFAVLFVACVPDDLLSSAVMVATLVLLGCGAYWSVFCADDDGPGPLDGEL